MIDKSQGFNDGDAPPPYQHALRSSSDSKVNLAPPSTGSPSASRSSSRSTLSKRHPNARTKPPTPPATSRWFPTSIFGLSKTAKQVRSATQGLLSDLLLQARPCEHEWVSVLGHCADTCSAHGLNFSTLIQEPFVEGHLPIYWAILKRPTSSPAAPAPVKGDHHTTTPSSGDHDALVFAIIDASIPLNPQTIADTRLACMTASDNALFHRLGRRYEAFSPRSGTDRVLLGGSDAIDTVEVVETRGGGGAGGSGAAAGAAFTVRFSITQFQLRMRVSKLARVEFIARGRLWYLAFSVAGVSNGPHMYAGRPGEWLVSLGLCDYSSPSWVDARLSIVDHPFPSTPPTTDALSIPQRMARLPLPPKHPQLGKHRPVASLPIRTGNYQISPGGPMREVVVSLDKFLPGANLQNDASSYVDADGTLNAEVEVKLQQTNVLEANCIIC